MTAMQYRRLGTAGVKVSAISLGAWLTYGSNRVAEEQAAACIRAAIEAGINFIDVADIYSYGKAEEVVGRVIKDYQRHKLVISTKAYWPMSEDVNDRGLSRKHIVESVEQSLRRFDMEYLDIFFCHRFDPETPLDETVMAVDDLIRQGKILYWGTSMWSAQNIADAYQIVHSRQTHRPVTEQPLYNMLDRHVVEGDLEAEVEKRGMGLVVWSPLAQGALTGKYNEGIPEGSRAQSVDFEWFKQQITEERIAKVRQLTALAQDMGTTTAALALAWVLKNKVVSSAIIGASRPEQLTENLKALEVTISDEIDQRIDSILQASPSTA
ncbi:MAG: aldo/keto reductase family protein [bacterium]|nr:aldo/keto reductase family protein [bacterium]